MFGRRSSVDSDLADVAQRRLAVLARQLEQARTVAPRRDNHQTDGANDARADGAAAAGPDPDPSRGGRGGRHVRAVPPRWWLSPPQVTIVALLVMAALLVASWWVLRSVPDSEQVQLTSERRLPPGAPTDPVAGAPSVSTPADGAPVSTPAADGVNTAAPSAGPVLVVDVAGKVRRPGIVELPAGSRVIDALHAAGGPRPRVDTSALNLARVLVDGEQIVVGLDVPVVPGPLPTATAGGTPTAVSPVDINVATQVELESLPGIGPVTATAILAWRTEHGAFTSVEELLEVSGIGEATLSEIVPYVYV